MNKLFVIFFILLMPFSFELSGSKYDKENPSKLYEKATKQLKNEKYKAIIKNKLKNNYNNFFNELRKNINDQEKFSTTIVKKLEELGLLNSKNNKSKDNEQNENEIHDNQFSNLMINKTQKTKKLLQKEQKLQEVMQQVI